MGNSLEQLWSSTRCWDGGTIHYYSFKSMLNYFKLAVLAALLVISGIEMNPGPVNNSKESGTSRVELEQELFEVMNQQHKLEQQFSELKCQQQQLEERRTHLEQELQTQYTAAESSDDSRYWADLSLEDEVPQLIKQSQVKETESEKERVDKQKLKEENTQPKELQLETEAGSHASDVTKHLKEVKEKKRQRRYNQEQVHWLVGHMETHRDFAAGRFSGMRGAESLEDDWEKLSLTLNELGPPKSSAQWRTVWRDLKMRTRAKYFSLKRASTERGNKKIGESLTDLETKIISITGTVSLVSDVAVPEEVSASVQPDPGSTDLATTSSFIEKWPSSSTLANPCPGSSIQRSPSPPLHDKRLDDDDDSSRELPIPQKKFYPPPRKRRRQSDFEDEDAGVCHKEHVSVLKDISKCLRNISQGMNEDREGRRRERAITVELLAAILDALEHRSE